jgi:ADP-L-glycero-D-manno-heptose 6-epimerase
MIIITGGAGFIGSNLVARWGKEFPADPLVVVDHLREADKWRNLASSFFVDLISPDQLFSFLHTHKNTIQRIIHLGALSSTVEKDGDKIIATNFRLSTQLWHWCAAAQVPFVYASSAATYGKGDQGFEDREEESYLSQLQPLNLYGWSKALFDRWVARTVAQGGSTPPQWVGLKFFNVYGPNEYHKGAQQSIIPQLFKALTEKGSLSLFKSHNPQWKDGDQSRDFIWIEDCLDIILWVCANPSVSGLLNVGSGESRSFREVAEAVFSAVGKRVPIEYKDMPLPLVSQYQYFTKADLSRLRQRGYRGTMTSLEEGVRAYITDYLMTENLYR